MRSDGGRLGSGTSGSRARAPCVGGVPPTRWPGVRAWGGGAARQGRWEGGRPKAVLPSWSTLGTAGLQDHKGGEFPKHSAEVPLPASLKRIETHVHIETCTRMFTAALLKKVKQCTGTSLVGPVAKTPSSQCRGPRFYPWSGN